MTDRHPADAETLPRTRLYLVEFDGQLVVAARSAGEALRKVEARIEADPAWAEFFNVFASHRLRHREQLPEPWDATRVPFDATDTRTIGEILDATPEEPWL